MDQETPAPSSSDKRTVTPVDRTFVDAWDAAVEAREAGTFDEAEFRAQHGAAADAILDRLRLLDRLGAQSLHAFGGAAPADALFEPGRRFGNYTIERELGRGGQGVVFLARDEKLDRPVALKVLTEGATRSDFLRRRFQREAEAASRLDHPAICSVYAIGEEEHIPYIAMRFVAGEPLSTRIARQRAASGGGETDSTPSNRTAFVEVVTLIEKVARALDAAHEAGLVHRDVKPGNIMVSETDEPVVLDFGLARDLDPEGPTLTRSGQVMGTPAYMSPEQISGEASSIDARTDVYALGVTLYESLLLRRPFEAPTVEKLRLQITNDEPPKPRRLNPRLPTDLAVILETALEKDPARRYQSAGAFAEDLRRWREHEPILARPVPRLRRATKWARRHPGLATALVAVLIGLPIVTSFTLEWRRNREKVLEADAARLQRQVDDLIDEGLQRNERSFRAGLSLFRRALALRPNALALYCAARGHIDSGEPDEARALVDRHASLVARVPGLNFARVEALRRLEQHEEADRLQATIPEPTSAVGFFVRSLAAEPKTATTRPQQWLAALEYAQGAVYRTEARRRRYLIQAGRVAARAGRADVAKRVIRSLLDLWPDSYQTHLAIGQTYMYLGDVPAELAAYEKAYRIKPTRNTAKALGQALAPTDRVEEAERLLRQAFEAGEVYAAAFLFRLLLRQGRAKDAEAVYLDALSRFPHEAQIPANLGQMYFERGRLDDARRHLERSLAVRPTAHAYSVLAMVDLAQGDGAAAKTHADAALEVDPLNAHALGIAGMIRTESGQHEEAVDFLRRALETEPDLADVHLNLGVALLRLNRLDESIESLRRATDCDPNFGEAWWNLGTALRDRGDLDEAIAALSRGFRPGSSLPNGNAAELESLERRAARAIRGWLSRPKEDGAAGGDRVERARRCVVALVEHWERRPATDNPRRRRIVQSIRRILRAAESRLPTGTAGSDGSKSWAALRRRLDGIAGRSPTR